MSYNIEPMSVKQFVTDASMKLPRFQRRSVWSEKQNFELCISIFQDYPVGVVIVNKEPESSWLLDGRQRRAALKEMRANPVSVYKWAKSYIKFSPTEDVTDLRTKYWQKVEDYLQKDTIPNEDGEDEEVVVGTEGEEIVDASSFNVEKQRKGLQTLLDLILMVHQIKGGISAWQKTFDFTKFMPLKYASRKDNFVVNPEKLRDFILEIIANVSEVNEQSVTDFYLDNSVELTEEKELKFKNAIHQRWTEIKNSIDVIKRTERIVSDACIGIIKLTNASPLDAQNIFTRINSGGTALKAEELLSAKAFWNVPISDLSSNLQSVVTDMYRKLGVESFEGIVRWDIAATLLKRIDKTHLVFDAYKEAAEKEEVNVEQVTFGFKLLSAIYQKGISGKNVADLERNRDIDWVSGLNELVADLNDVFDLLLDDAYFKNWNAWGKPFTKLFGAAPALEFITIVYQDWIDKGRPGNTSAKMREVQRDAKILLDKLICEYGSGIWHGSGDKRMANHVANISERIKVTDLSVWKNMVEAGFAGEYNGQVLARKQVIPLLYYSYILQDLAPSVLSDVTYDVDHTMPQAWFEGNSMVNQKLKDSLTNLALLPKKQNISKSDKALKEISDTWLRQQIVIFTGISEADFEKYSDIMNITVLQSDRKAKYMNLIMNERVTKLAN